YCEPSHVRLSGIFSLLFSLCHDAATTEIYTLSLHDALPISEHTDSHVSRGGPTITAGGEATAPAGSRYSRSPSTRPTAASSSSRSEEHTSELQSRENLVCRLLLEKKKQTPSSTSDRCRACAP